MRLLAAAQPLRNLNDRFRCWPRTALDPIPTFVILTVQRLDSELSGRITQLLTESFLVIGHVDL